MARTAAASTPGPAVPWRRYVGAWLGIGSSPGALVLGAQLVDEHGPLPLVWLVLGAALMATLLLLQGRLGLRPPAGWGTTFAELSRDFLPSHARAAVGLLIAAGMVGWVGFGVGIGAESLARITGASQALCALCLGGLVLALATRDVRRWNAVAVGTTLATVVLAPLLLLGVDRVEVPVTAALPGGLDSAVILAAFVGYIAVFMLRSPDVTAGLDRWSGLVICVVALVLPALMLMVVGAALQVSAAGTAGASLAALPGMRLGPVPVGDLLVVLAILAPAVTSAFSGGLALQTFTGAPARVGIAVISAAGLALGVLQFHRELVDWLALLAGVGPPIAVAFWVEAARRRRGRAPRPIPTWVWLPPAVAGVTLVALGVGWAPLLALAAAGLLAGIWGVTGRRIAAAPA